MTPSAEPSDRTILAKLPEATAFSSVILTLVSIVVALAIEQLLTHASEQLELASGSGRLLIVAQGLTMFLVSGAIWTTYVTMIMTASWAPRFQDFFAPLVILGALYVGIRMIGVSDPLWFCVAGLGWANAFAGQRLALPPEVAERMKPDSALAWRAHGTNLVLFVLAMVGALTVHLGAANDTAAAVLVFFLAGIQLLAAWFQYAWWRAS